MELVISLVIKTAAIFAFIFMLYGALSSTEEARLLAEDMIAVTPHPIKAGMIAFLMVILVDQIGFELIANALFWLTASIAVPLTLVNLRHQTGIFTPE